MNRAGIDQVERDAKRLLRLCTELKGELDGHRGYITGTKRSGALRRASLDLTRSLAEMRKP